MFNSLIELIQVLPSTSSYHMVLGIILLLASLIIAQKNYNRGVLLLLLSSLFIALAFATVTPYLHPWDEQFHALVAKHLTETPLTPRLLPSTPVPIAIENWNENHVWLHKPPLSLWQMSLIYSLFGVNVLTTRLASILLFVGTVFLVYKIGSLLKNQKTGYYAAVLFGSLNYVYTLVAGLHTAEHIDIAFQFYITLSCFFGINYLKSPRWYWLVLMGISSGGAILTKWLVGLLAYAGIGLTLILQKQFRTDYKTWLHLTYALLATLLVSLPWQLYSFYHYPEAFIHETTFSSRHFYEVIEDHAGGPLFYWENLKDIYGTSTFGQVIILLSVLFIGFTIKRKFVPFLLVSILTPYLFFSIATTKMDSFLTIVQPLICIGLSALFITLLDNFTSIKWSSWRRYLTVPLIFCLSLLLLRPNQIKRDFLLDNHINQSKRDAFIEQHEYIQNFKFPSEEKIVLFDINYLPAIHVSWMFYHDIVAYQRNFSNEEIKFLLANNISLYTFVGNGLKPIKHP